MWLSDFLQQNNNIKCPYSQKYTRKNTLLLSFNDKKGVKELLFSIKNFSLNHCFNFSTYLILPEFVNGVFFPAYIYSCIPALSIPLLLQLIFHFLLFHNPLIDH